MEKAFVKELVTVRLRHQLTQEKMALLLNCSVAAVRHWEQNKVCPNWKTLSYRLTDVDRILSIANHD